MAIAMRICPSLAALALVALALPRTADAQAGSYDALIDEALSEFDAGRFAEARALFRRAHTEAPSARTLRGVGIASYEMGDYAEAHRALSAARVDPRRPLSDEQRASAEALIARSARFLGFYRVVIAVESAELIVDGRTAALEPDGRLMLALGTHTIVARAAEHRDALVTIEVRGGEEAEVALHPEPEPGEPAAPRVSTEVEPLSRGVELEIEPVRAEPPFDPALPIALLVSGGSAAVAAIVTGLAWWRFVDQEHAVCAAAGPACSNLSEIQDARSAAAAVTVALSVAGAVLLVIGAVTMTVDSSRASALRCAPGAGCGVVF